MRECYRASSASGIILLTSILLQHMNNRFHIAKCMVLYQMLINSCLQLIFQCKSILFSQLMATSQYQSGSQTPRLPPVLSPTKKQLHTQLSLTRTRKLILPLSQRKAESSPRQQKVISHFLIRYLERKELFQDKQMQRTIVNEQKKSEPCISPPFRRAMIKIRNTPRKPLQTRFLIANHESISFA